MTHQAKASSAGSTEAGKGRRLIHRAFPTRGASESSKGIGARSTRHAGPFLAVVSLVVAAFAITAAPAGAAATAEIGAISDVSYTSAHVTGKVTATESFRLYRFEYSTNEVDWNQGPSGFFSNPVTNETVQGTLTVPKGATKYFVRLTVASFGGTEAVSPASAPYPSFTTLAVDPATFPGTVGTSQIFSTSATVTGKVKRPANTDSAFDISACRFEYVTEAEFIATGFGTANPVPCDQATPFTTPDGETDVTAALTGLSPSTSYHLRLVAENAAPGTATKEAAAPFTTNPKQTALPSVVATDNVKNLSPDAGLKRTAQVSGEVERPAGADPALDVSCRFEYVTNQQFTEHGFENAGQATCLGPNELQSLTIAATAGQFRLSYGGQTTSDIRFNAFNYEVQEALRGIGAEVLVDGGPGDGAGSTPYRITFVGGLGEKDVAQIVATNGATPLAGTFNVSTLTTGATAFEALNDPPTNQPKAIRAELSGLEPGTTYHLRLTAENGVGTVSKEAASTFTTFAIVHPSFTLDSVSKVGYASFTATGTVDPGNQWASPMFEFSQVGTETWEGNQLGRFIFVRYGEPPMQVSYTFPCTDNYCESAPLKPGTTYKVRLSGRDEEEYNYYHSPEPYLEFTTKGTSTFPSVTFSPVTDVTATTAHFSANVNTHAPAGPLDEEGRAVYKTDWHFECTPECPAASGSSLSGAVTAEEGSQEISSTALRLQPHTYYEVKLIAHNGAGTVETPLQPFETPLVKPTVESAPGGSDGEGGYIIEGVVNSNNSKITDCRFEYGTTSVYPNTYNAPCLPSPSGPNEVQQVDVDAGEGQFRLSFRGQITGDLAYDASPAEVQTALRALSKIGSAGVNVTGTAQSYKVTFTGSLAGTNVEPLKSSNGTTPLAGGGGGGVSVSTTTEGGINHRVSIEAHLENLTIGSTYHFRIFATNAAGTESSADRIFVPTLAPKGPTCPNEQVRKENFSLGLPECRAYEMVTYPNKEGEGVSFRDFDGGEAVLYASNTANIANSGSGYFNGNNYAATRTAAGWETISNLNGPTGSMQSPPNSFKNFGPNLYSADFQSSAWYGSQAGGPYGMYLRKPGGEFVPMGNGGTWLPEALVGTSDDLSHLVFNNRTDAGGGGIPPIFPGPAGSGIAEFVGIGNGDPRRVDLDNLGHPISECGNGNALVSHGDAVSRSGEVVIFTENSCAANGIDNGVRGDLWARVGGTTSYDLSASLCDRADCSDAAPSAHYQGSTPDGSRVFFTTIQQLLNGDTDETNDLYVCDIPITPQAPTGRANPCSSLREVSAGSGGNAQVQEVLSTSSDGSTAYFTAKGVLADNENLQGETAIPAERNLYVWRSAPTDPAGEIIFVAGLPEGDSTRVQSTPDGRYLLLQTAARLVPTDADESLDLYRYDAVTGEMARVSTGVSGAGGNAGFDSMLLSLGNVIQSPHNSHPSISDDGQLIVFATAEPLTPLDGNNEPDAYLWSHGHVLGSVGPMFPRREGSSEFPAQVNIDGSGQDIYIETSARLTPTDVDANADIYDVRVNGGFPLRQEGCLGESCQPGQTSPPAPKSLPSQGTGPGNPPPPKSCPKGKVLKRGSCVKKPKKPKKHTAKKHHGKRAGHKQGSGK